MPFCSVIPGLICLGLCFIAEHLPAPCWASAVVSGRAEGCLLAASCADVQGSVVPAPLWSGTLMAFSVPPLPVPSQEGTRGLVPVSQREPQPSGTTTSWCALSSSTPASLGSPRALISWLLPNQSPPLWMDLTYCFRIL